MLFWILAGIGAYLVLAILVWKLMGKARVRAVRRELLAGVMPSALTGSGDVEPHESPRHDAFGTGKSGPGFESRRPVVGTSGRTEASVDAE